MILVEDVSPEDESDGIEYINNPQEEPNKKKEVTLEESAKQFPGMYDDEDAPSVQSTDDSSVDSSEDEWDITSLAMDDDNWESQWEDSEQMQPETAPNSKIHSSLPMHTREEMQKDDEKADAYWNQVLMRQMHKQLNE
eukprot:2353769-Ditylum_brightwellii.AAC.1